MSNITLLILSYIGSLLLGVAAWLIFKYVKNIFVQTFGGGALVCAVCIVFFSSFNIIQNMAEENRDQPKQEIVDSVPASQPDSILIDSVKWK